MSFTIVRSISTNFVSLVTAIPDVALLKERIEGHQDITTDLLSVGTANDDCSFEFSVEPSAPEIVVLDEIVEAHTGLRVFPGLDAEFAYDGEGKLIEVSYNDGSTKTLTYNAEGQLIQVVHGDLVKNLTYNPDGTLASVENV